jgi:hypothetical protein
MPNYLCNCCNFDTKLRSNLNRHLTTKKHNTNLINSLHKTTNIQTSLIPPSILLNFGDNIEEKPSILLNSSKKKNNCCNFCNRNYSRLDNLKRHLDTGCKVQIKIEKEKEKDIKYLKDTLDTLINGNISGNNNKINNYNTTNIQQNNTINLNVFGSEDLSMLTDEFKKELIKGPFKMMSKLMETVYFNNKYPENHTIKMVNKNKELMKVHNKDGWKLVDKKDTVDYILEETNYEVDSFYDTNEEEFSHFVKKTYNKFRTLFDTRNIKLWKKTEREIDLVLWNNM